MGFYNIGEKKNRPGVYIRIVNRGADAAKAAAAAPVIPSRPGGGGDEVVSAIVISPEGVLSAGSHSLSLGAGSATDGYAIVVGSDISAVVTDETLVITNSAV